MNKLIYFQSRLIARCDKFLVNDDYPGHNWFNLANSNNWGEHICSRSTQLDVPWPLAKSLSTIPQITNNETRFDIVLDQIAEKFYLQVKQTQRTPYIMWSGGIDSTSILVSLLKTTNNQVLDNLVVVCNQDSIDENPYFYNQYIKNKLAIVDTDQFKVTSENYNKMLLVNGDCAEMIFGSTHPHTLARQGQMDIIHKSCDNDTLLRRSMKTTNPKALDFSLEIIKESIKHSPVPIETVYDFLWWHYFNFKIVDSLLRPMVYLAEELTDEQTADFWTNTFQRFYMYPEMQIWSMLTNNIRRENMHIDYKYDAKKYIYKFDRNDFYYNNKQKYPSMIKNTASDHIFAIDENWRRYSIANVNDRQTLGQWLNRI
jgi:hypothetical protein